VGGNFTEEEADHALREVVGFDLAGRGQISQSGRQVPVPADDAREQPLMGQMVEAAGPAVALTGRLHEGEVARPGFLQKAGFEG
jgi:hypothetical protein